MEAASRARFGGFWTDDSPRSRTSYAIHPEVAATPSALAYTEAVTRDGFTRATCFVLVVAVGAVAGCVGAKQEGHATYFVCQDGKIESMHVPLDEDPEFPDFEDCGDGSCVLLGEECPTSRLEPQSPEKANNPE